jgi:hypothetical protein
VVKNIARCAALLASLIVSGCAGTGAFSSAPSLERPGTRITLNNPDAEKWAAAARRANAPPPRPGQVAQVWVCRPLACAGDAAVGIQSQASPTRHPDRAALEKIAKFLPAQARAQDVMMEAASDGEERMTPLASKVTEIRGYPAVVAEAKRTSKAKVSYSMRGQLFVGTMLVHVVSLATDRAEAKKHFDAFVAAIEILDVPPADDPAGAPAPTALESAPAPATQ